MTSVVEDLTNRYAKVFDPDNQDPIKGYQATIHVKEGCTPVFHKPYTVPFAMIPIMDEKLDALLASDRIYPVRYSRWASPILLTNKKEHNPQATAADSKRMCVDFKKTVDLNTETEHYKLPVPNDLFAAQANGVCWTVLDLSDAFTQLEVDEASQEYLTINTHRGLFRFRRLIYGINSAPSIFQQTMDCILQGLENVFCYIDDILVKGTSYQDCVKTVCAVLQRLEDHNVKLKASKCVWFAPEVEYLGHILSASGRRPAPSKVTSVEQAKSPTSVKEVRSLLGLVEFYAQYLPHASTILKPISDLTHTGVPFEWTERCAKAFPQIKHMLKDKILTHYNPDLEILLMTDASPVGIGVALCHAVMENGKRVETPVLFASCTLSDRQMRYSQIDREALGIIYGIKKCHKYLYGRRFTIVTDNSAVTHIFNPKKSIPVHSANRLVGWAYFLRAYDYTIVHRKSALLAVPDALSRLPAEGAVHEVHEVPEFGTLPVTCMEIAQATSQDPVLSKVMQFVYQGWPKANHPTLTDELKPYFNRRLDLSIAEKCLMCNKRVVIPASLQAHVLNLLHIGHPGAVRTKMAARRIVYWVGMDRDIEAFAENCMSCRVVNFKPSPDLIPWPLAKSPFVRLHMDFCQLHDTTYLVMCDSYSKWIEAVPTATATAAAVIDELLRTFAVWGYPRIIVADKGPPFDSQALKDFCTTLNITLLHSPPYHPTSNGLGERAVQVVKRGLRKLFPTPEKETSRRALAVFLFAYRNTPSTTTSKSPNEMLLSFSPRTLLTNLNPAFNPVIRSLENVDLYRENDIVLLRVGKKPVVTGKVLRKLSATRYLVCAKGILMKPHINQMAHAPPVLK